MDCFLNTWSVYLIFTVLRGFFVSCNHCWATHPSLFPCCWGLCVPGVLWPNELSWRRRISSWWRSSELGGRYLRVWNCPLSSKSLPCWEGFDNSAAHTSVPWWSRNLWKRGGTCLQLLKKGIKVSSLLLLPLPLKWECIQEGWVRGGTRCSSSRGWFSKSVKFLVVVSWINSLVALYGPFSKSALPELGPGHHCLKPCIHTLCSSSWQQIVCDYIS